jgi:hypothetical protein
MLKSISEKFSVESHQIGNNSRTWYAHAFPASPDSLEPPPPITVAGQFPVCPRPALPQPSHPLHGVPRGCLASSPTSRPPRLPLPSPPLIHPVNEFTDLLARVSLPPTTSAGP